MAANFNFEVNLMFIKHMYKKLILSLGVFLLSLNAYAADIDIFLGDPDRSAGNPNILIILDNTAN